MTRTITEIVEQQVNRWNQEQRRLKEKLAEDYVPSPVITFSRLLGSRGSEIAAIVADRLECELVGISIVDEIIRRSEVRKDLVDALDEKTRSEVSAWIDKLVHGRTLDGGDQLRYHLEAINYFVKMGNVVMLGRGAAFVPKIRPRIDVRIVASMDRRIEHLAAREGVTRAAAIMKINASDDQRTKFVKDMFAVDWWDARAYNLVINTDEISVQTAASMVETCWLRRVADLTSQVSVTLDA